MFDQVFPRIDHPGLQRLVYVAERHHSDRAERANCASSTLED